jgi:CotS family spore coat protein
MYCSSSHLRWIDRTLQMIRKRGFTKLGWPDRSMKPSLPLLIRFKSFFYPFVVVPWFKGRWPSPKSLSDMYRCGRTLAKFHQASKGLAAKSFPPAIVTPRWQSMLEQDRKLLVRLINTSKNHPVRRLLQPLLEQHSSEILHYANEAKLLLQQSNYATLRNSSRHLLYICHGDGGPSNFIFRPNGIYLIDFETMRLDFRAYDLYRIIYNSCKGHQWKFSIARALLDGYQSVSKLTPDDFAFIKIWLRYPRTMRLFLNNSPKEVGKKKERLRLLFLAALETERKMASFLRKLDEYAKSA